MAAPPPHFVSAEHLAFAAHIVRSEFSPLMERLTTYMLTFGPTALPELVRETGIAPTRDDGRPDPAGLALARNALLALMQQNIVSCPVLPIVDTSYVARKRRESGYLPPPVYAASLEEIFARLWFPRIVLKVRETYGEDEGLLIQQLLNFGRMSVESLVSHTTAAYAELAQLGVDDPKVREKEKALQEAAKRLQTAKYIVNVEPLPPRPVRSAAAATGGSAAAASGGAAASASSSSSSAAAAAAAASSSSSASVGGRGGRKRAATAPPVAEQASSGKAPAKRRKSAAAQKAEAEAAAFAEAAARAAAVAAAAAAAQPQVKLVRCALDRYRRELRQEAIQRFVSDKLDNSAAHIVKIVMEMQVNVRDQMGGLGAGDGDKLSPPFTIDALQARWNGAPSRKDIQQYLDLMCQDPMCRMATALNGDVRYLLQLREIGACIKQLMLECAIRDKFGELAFRVFRLLLLRRPTGVGGAHVSCKLELKQLAELALLPERDARPHLMKLLKHDYVLLQELPRTADHNPRTTTYLWHVDIEHAYRTLERDMFRTMGTLFGRIAHEQRVNAPALAAVQPQMGMTLDYLSEAQQEEARVAQRKIDCLENALLQVHHTAMKMRAIA